MTSIFNAEIWKSSRNICSNL